MKSRRKVRLLFVDDESNVLQGLERMLRPMHREWNMSFVLSGSEALDILSREPCDVLICDMCMPGLDGSQVLERVRELYPDTTRIVLSGVSDRMESWKAISLAHTYLAKPCDGQTVKAVIAQAIERHRLLTQEPIRHAVSKLEFLPFLPENCRDLSLEIDSPEPDLDKAARIITRDIGMTAKVLQVANSAFEGRSRQISDPNEALNCIGVEGLRSLAFSYRSSSQVKKIPLSNSLNEVITRHSILVGSIAQMIAREKSDDKAWLSGAFTAGLLHGAGSLVLAAHYPEEYDQILGLSCQKEINLWEMEQGVFQTTHAAVGAYLIGLWGLHPETAEALAFHHTPKAGSQKDFNLVTVVHVADFLASQSDESKSAGGFYALDMDYLSEIGLAKHLPAWQDKCKTVLEYMRKSGNE